MSDSSKATEAIANLAEMFSVIRDATIGHRNALVGAGIAPDIADHMAAEYHQAIITYLLEGLKS